MASKLLKRFKTNSSCYLELAHHGQEDREIMFFKANIILESILYLGKSWKHSLFENAESLHIYDQQNANCLKLGPPTRALFCWFRAGWGVVRWHRTVPKKGHPGLLGYSYNGPRLPHHFKNAVVCEAVAFGSMRTISRIPSRMSRSGQLCAFTATR